MNAAGVREYRYKAGGVWYSETKTLGAVTYTLTPERGRNGNDADCFRGG